MSANVDDPLHDTDGLCSCPYTGTADAGTKLSALEMSQEHLHRTLSCVKVLANVLYMQGNPPHDPSSSVGQTAIQETADERVETLHGGYVDCGDDVAD